MVQVDKRLGSTSNHWRSDWLILDEHHFGFSQSVFVVGETFKMFSVKLCRMWLQV